MSVSAGLGHNRRNGRSRVYAITFDFDTSLLGQLYPNQSWRSAYSDVRRFSKRTVSRTSRAQFTLHVTTSTLSNASRLFKTWPRPTTGLRRL